LEGDLFISTRKKQSLLRLNPGVRAFSLNRAKMMQFALALVALLAWLEWHFQFDFSLGIFYIFPIMVAAIVLEQWQVVLAAIFCALVRGVFTPQETMLEYVLRFCMATIAYAGCGLLVYQINYSQRLMLSHYIRIRKEQKLRRKAEEQLRLLAESSPAAILTVASSGQIIAVNQAAYGIFGAEEDTTLLNHDVRDYLPLLADALSLSPEIDHIRTSATTWARRADGTVFPATAWFSIYGAKESRSLAAIVVDDSEEVRERERSHFEQMVNTNRVFAGAVSHEIRNLCSAIAVVTSSLARQPGMADNPDFQAMKSLVSGLSKLASFNLRNQAKKIASSVAPGPLLNELRVIIGQDWEDVGGTLHWKVSKDLSTITADHQDLLKILLNLSKNSLRAVEGCPIKELTIEVLAHEHQSVIRICDTGAGVADVSLLFQPFHPESNGTGLGLYISRAMIRSFGGDLLYVPVESGCCFEIVVPC
jgi:two-component system sensor kinase FixL